MVGREMGDKTQVFLNYRVVDEPFGAAMLDIALSERFGAAAVFLASKSIPLGSAWEEEMFAAVTASAAFLVVMGRNWLDARDKDGRRRIEDPTDFVRREIELAMKLGKNVIPVRLGVPRLTKHSALPTELAGLLSCQDTEVRYRAAKVDIDQLADKLKSLIPELNEPAPPAKPAASTFAVHGPVGHVTQIQGLKVRRDLTIGTTNNYGTDHE
jgi:hypothetical protein